MQSGRCAVWPLCSPLKLTSASGSLERMKNQAAAKPMTATGEKYHHLGAHADTQDGVTGVRFSVWAPNATEVCVLTDGNGWQHGCDCLGPSDSGVWSGFLSGAGEGTRWWKEQENKTDT